MKNSKCNVDSVSAGTVTSSSWSVKLIFNVANPNPVSSFRKGTYALPISTKSLGSTINTGSTQATANTLRTVDVDPAPDLRITPTAAACSACHDGSSAKNHMVQTGGASFSTLQSNILPGVTEKCVNCHGPGKSEDVRRVHEIGFDR